MKRQQDCVVDVQGVPEPIKQLPQVTTLLSPLKKEANNNAKRCRHASGTTPESAELNGLQKAVPETQEMALTQEQSTEDFYKAVDHLFLNNAMANSAAVQGFNGKLEEQMHLLNIAMSQQPLSLQSQMFPYTFASTASLMPNFTIPTTTSLFNGAPYPSLSRLNQQADQSGVYKCRKCDRTFKWLNLMKKHMHSCMGKDEWKCNVCSYTTHHYSNIYIHVRIHIGDKRYKCGGCGASFVQGVCLKQHISARHGDNKMSEFFVLHKKDKRERLNHLWTRIKKNDSDKVLRPDIAEKLSTTTNGASEAVYSTPAGSSRRKSKPMRRWGRINPIVKTESAESYNLQYNQSPNAFSTNGFTGNPQGIAIKREPVSSPGLAGGLDLRQSYSQEDLDSSVLDLSTSKPSCSTGATTSPLNVPGVSDLYKLQGRRCSETEEKLVQRGTESINQASSPNTSNKTDDQHQGPTDLTPPELIREPPPPAVTPEHPPQLTCEVSNPESTPISPPPTASPNAPEMPIPTVSTSAQPEDKPTSHVSANLMESVSSALSAASTSSKREPSASSTKSEVSASTIASTSSEQCPADQSTGECSHKQALRSLRSNVMSMLSLLVPNLDWARSGIDRESDKVDQLLEEVIYSNLIP